MTRPKQVSDARIFEIVFSIILKEGLENLTFERIGREAGLVRSAIVNRFRNKHQLLLEADAHYLEQSAATFEEAVQKESSPIEAIYEALCAEMRFATSQETYANGSALLLLAYKTPEMFANYKNAFVKQRNTIAALLRQASDGGLLVRDIDHDQLAREIQVTQQGAAHMWMMLQEMPLDEYITQHIDAALKPHRQHQGLPRDGKIGEI